MKIKALKEKRSKLLNDLEVMISSLETEDEVRSLTDEEKQAFDDKKKEIENIDATINMIEETRAKAVGGEKAVEKVREERNKADIEIRALNKFFRGHDLDAEERAVLASNSNNQALFPLEISKTILMKLEELCPILEMARRFSSKGTLRLIKEDSYGVAALTGEKAEFHDDDVNLSNIELRSYKIAAKVETTIEMLANVDIDLSGYLTDVIIKRLSKEINKLFLKGTGSNQPQGLVQSKNVAKIKETFTIDDFIRLQTTINPTYLDKAVWIVNRSTFQKIACLMDNVGRPYLVHNIINDKIQYTLLGCRVIVDEHMDNSETGNKSIILVNVEEAYSINVLQDIVVKHLTEIGFTQGYEIFAGYVMVDGKLVNEDACLVAEVEENLVKKK